MEREKASIISKVKVKKLEFSKEFETHNINDKDLENYKKCLEDINNFIKELESREYWDWLIFSSKSCRGYYKKSLKLRKKYEKLYENLEKKYSKYLEEKKAKESIVVQKPKIKKIKNSIFFSKAGEKSSEI